MSFKSGSHPGRGSRKTESGIRPERGHIEGRKEHQTDKTGSSHDLQGNIHRLGRTGCGIRETGESERRATGLKITKKWDRATTMIAS
jgi:hypothetical protein